MKYLFLFLIIFIAVSKVNSQSKIVDPINPILSFEFGYHPLNQNLILTVVLNAVDNTQSVPNPGTVNFKAAIEGVINWVIVPASQNARILSGTAQLSPTKNAFVYTIDIKTVEGALIFAPSTSRMWRNIEKFKIKYDIDGKYNEYPSTTVYPPSTSLPTNRSIKILSRSRITGTQTGEINIESTPVGTPFKINLPVFSTSLLINNE